MSERLLILADDLTGSLDTGVQLAVKGYRVNVLVQNTGIPRDCHEDVLVINTDSRHIESKDAYRIVYDLAEQAKNAGFRRIYKKTDSGLRGNVGAELSALLEAAGEKTLSFVPAWPKMNRMTKDGIHYVNGLPLAESIFAKDVINPVKESRIERLIHLQSDVKVSLNPENEEPEGIAVYDCSSEEEMERLAAKIFAESDKPLIAAGCAGLLEKYPECIKDKDVASAGEGLYGDLLVLCGSMNEVSAKQLQFAQNKNAYRQHLPVSEILREQWTEEDMEHFVNSFVHEAIEPVSIIDTMDDAVCEEDLKENAAERIAEYMGKIAAILIRQKIRKTMMIIGGDTLLGCVKALGIETLKPLKEPVPGTVLAEYTNHEGTGYLITKSGGFGDEELLVSLQKKLEEKMI